MNLKWFCVQTIKAPQVLIFWSSNIKLHKLSAHFQQVNGSDFTEILIEIKII